MDFGCQYLNMLAVTLNQVPEMYISLIQDTTNFCEELVEMLQILNKFLLIFENVHTRFLDMYIVNCMCRLQG